MQQEYDSARPTYTGSPINKKKRPSSNYIKQKSISESHRNFEKVRNNIQLTLIEQVNAHQKSLETLQDDSTDVSSDPTDTMYSVGDEQQVDSRQTRAQRVHQSQTLAPVFQKLSNYHTDGQRAVSSIQKQSGHQIIKTQQTTPKQENKISQAKVQVSPMESCMRVSPSGYNARVIDPETAPAPNERQIKYLGLIIEKDEEQLIEMIRPPSLYDDDQSDNVYYVKVEDPIKRQYLPIRDKYIRIVKNCRKLTIESYEKRGRKDFKRTTKSLLRIGRQIANDDY